MTRRRWRLGLAGWPVAHSLSPELWEAVGARRGIDVEYARIPVRPDDEDAWESLWASDLAAFNVTAPYKDRAAGRCETLDPAARRIGAANTIVRRAGAWVGHSTDGYGFARSVLAVQEPLRDRRVVVLGTGGGGRAVAVASAAAGADVALVSRDPSREPQGCADLPRGEWGSIEELAPLDILVNATPVGRGAQSGAPPVPYGRVCAGALAVDLNYAPPVTPFLRAARAAGARILNGLGMLVYQACLAAALVFDGDSAAAESYEEDFWAAAREIAPEVLS